MRRALLLAGLVLPLLGPVAIAGSLGPASAPTGPQTVSGTVATRTPVTLTMTVVTVPGGNVVTRVSQLNANRKSLQVLQIGTGFASVVTNPTSTLTTTISTGGGTTAFVAGVGYPLEVASAAGHQGGSTPIWDGVNDSTDAVDAVSAAGTTLLVIEGN